MDAASGVVLFLGTYLFFILLLSYTILFGGSPRHSSSCIGRANTFLTETLGSRCQSFLSRVFCRGAENPAERMAASCDRALACFEERAMPVIYLGLLVAGLATARAIIVPRLADLNPEGVLCPPTRAFCVSGTPLTLPPTTHPSALWGWAIVCFGSWLRVYLADPGVITAENYSVLKKVYPYDGVLFVEGKECETCGFVKLPRSKHDRAYGKCVMRYDHFCGWTGNVIGLFNTGHFVFFLMTHLAMLCHGTMLIVEILWSRFLVFIDDEYTYTPTGKKITSFTLPVAFTAEPMLCLFFFIVIVSIGVVAGFLTYHAYLVSNNTTTSETFKWSPIKEVCADFMTENHGRSYGEKLKEDARKRAEGDPDMLHDVPKFGRDGMPCNIYDRGLVANFLEVAFPRLFVETGPSRLSDAASKDD